MAEVSSPRPPWRSLLACSSAALAIPICYCGLVYLDTRRAHLPAIPGHPEMVRDARVFEWAIKQLWVRAFLGEVVVSLALGVLTCWVIYRRRTARGSRVVDRVMTDVGLALAFVTAPWLVPAVGSLRLPGGNPIDVWVIGDVLRNALPGLAAVAAGVAFYLASREREQVGGEQPGR